MKRNKESKARQMNSYTYVKAREPGTLEWKYFRFGSAFTESEILERLSKVYGLNRDTEFITGAEYVRWQIKIKLQEIMFAILYILLGILKCIPRWILMLLETWGTWWVLTIICSRVKSVDWALAASDFIYWISVAIIFAYYVIAEKLKKKSDKK